MDGKIDHISLMSHVKINRKWMKAQTWRSKNNALDRIGESCDPGLGNGFFDMILKTSVLE